MPHTATLEAFEAALAQTLATAATAASDRTWEAQPTATHQPAAISPAAPSNPNLRLALDLTGALTGTLLLEIAEAEAGLLFPAAAPAGLPAAWAQLGQPVAQQLGRTLTQALGQISGQIGVSVSAIPQPPPASPADGAGQSLTHVVLRANDEFTAVTILCAADPALAAALEAAPRVPAATASRRSTPMDRVVDVPLAVTIRFGQRHLLLRELLELGTGSLLELDRQVEEPVDLMLGERVIARGEVVIVDGNYGMRVTEVLENANRPAASRDRLQTLSYASA